MDASQTAGVLLQTCALDSRPVTHGGCGDLVEDAIQRRESVILRKQSTRNAERRVHAECHGDIVNQWMKPELGRTDRMAK